jgi:acyl-coenzyme A thioesterase PaaI-like protein
MGDRTDRAAATRGETMTEHERLLAAVYDILRARLGDRIDDYAVPPPVFSAMQGQFLTFDVDRASLRARFPVLESYLNPYGTMQGGVMAAAIDNTLGPLSMLVAPPNVTRRLEVTYSQPATLDMGHVVVSARLLERNGRWLHLRADARSPEGARLARAKATHWVLNGT